MTYGSQDLVDAERAHYRRRVEHLESIINWIAHHPLNNIVGDCIGGGWSCDTYPDDHGNRQESHANDHIEAIEKAMLGETE